MLSTPLKLLFAFANIPFLTSKSKTFCKNFNNQSEIIIENIKFLETQLNTPKKYFNQMYEMCQSRGVYQRFYSQKQRSVGRFSSESVNYLDEFHCRVERKNGTTITSNSSSSSSLLQKAKKLPMWLKKLSERSGRKKMTHQPHGTIIINKICVFTENQYKNRFMNKKKKSET